MFDFVSFKCRIRSESFAYLDRNMLNCSMWTLLISRASFTEENNSDICIPLNLLIAITEAYICMIGDVKYYHSTIITQ